MNKLIIVESPNKIKKLESFLPDEYKVLASVGHVRDLMSKGENQLGVDWETIEPYYKIMKDKKEIVEDLKKASDKADIVYLAMDPDREGEAIAWHLQQTLEIPEDGYERITFNEISKDSVLNAIESPRKIDIDLVHAQESRRVLDRVVGFRLSRVVQKKVKARSAGRVQSAALKIIMDRELERRSFVPDRWWTLEAEYKADQNFVYINEKGTIEKVESEKELNDILKKLGEEFKITNMKKGERTISRPDPLEMSTYLSGMFSNYGMSNTQASIAVQKLYEKGFTSYPRTDSIRISSKEFLDQTEKFIKKTHGEDMFISLGEFKPKKRRKESEQDAHEAIRPTDIQNTPASMAQRLDSTELKAYSFIWRVTMQSMMPNGVNESQKYTFDNNGYNFTFSTSKTKEPGYRILNDQTKEQKLAEKTFLDFNKIYEKDNNSIIKIKKDKINAIENETKPPSRYTQASLIKKMKEVGIGRPSTYSPTTKLLFDRQYITSEGSSLNPTELGELVSRKLQEKFSDVINNEYTSEVEHTFDDIAHADVDYKVFLKDFYLSFNDRVEDALETMEMEIIPPKFTGEKCLICGKPMVEKYSPVTKKDFEACSDYPTCKYIKGSELKKPPIELEEKCPNCKKPLLIRFHEERGPFKACSNFPRCRKYGAKPLTPEDVEFLKERSKEDKSITKELDKYYENIDKREAQAILRENKLYVPKEMKEFNSTELNRIIDQNDVDREKSLESIEQKRLAREARKNAK